MLRFTPLRTALLTAFLCTALFNTAYGFACPLPWMRTLADRMWEEEVVVVGQWVEATEGMPGKKGRADTPGSTTFILTRILESAPSLKEGDRITVKWHRTGKVGGLFLLFGKERNGVMRWGDDGWDNAFEVTDASIQYITEAPSLELPRAERVPYFLKFLENPAPQVARDAYVELRKIPHKDLALHAKTFPREKLRKWIHSAEPSDYRVGLYGEMLGYCGDDTDAELLKAKILQEATDGRLGIEGMIAGYLILKGEDGLSVIEEHNLKNKQIPRSEAHAALFALRFMWTYGEGRISRDRLSQSMRLLLDRPDATTLAVLTFALWEDWSVRDDLMKMYGQGEFNTRSIKWAIIRYMLTCAGKPTPDGAEPLPQVIDARNNLTILRKQDPEAVAEAERGFVLPSETEDQ